MTLAVAPICCAVASSSETIRATSTTLAPMRPNSTAMARPIPRPAPVTTATLPSIVVIYLFSDLLILVLQLVELVIQAALGQQFLMRSHLTHTSLVHHENLVALLNRREPVGDDDRSASLHETVDRLP